MIKKTIYKVTLLLLLFLAACGPVPVGTPTPPPEATEAEEEENFEETGDEGDAQDMDEEMSDVTEEDEPPAEESSAPGPAAAFDPAIYDDLRSTDPDLAREAVERLANSGDLNNTAILLEMFRAAQIGLVEVAPPVAAEALMTLTGQPFGGDWPAWVEWYGTTDLVPPEGFTTWKGELLIPIDPRFTDFLQDEHPVNVRVEEIVWGGVRVDGIPALDNSPMIPAAEAVYMMADDVVFGLSINGDNRAYPLKILDWHEMANDVVGGVPVSLAYCTLCGAAVAYDGRASDGETYTFGSSGFLFRSNKLMYDRETRTLWNQLTGEPVLGELVDTGVTLDILPVVLTTWQEWQNQHPDTLVLDDNTGFQRPYVAGAAYGDYFSASDTMFPVWQRSELLEDKSQVYALRLNGIPTAYPLDLLAQERVVNHAVGETNVVVLGGDLLEVDGLSRRAGEVTYTAGSEVRAYDRGELTFAPGEAADQIMDQDGSVWQVTEDALIGPDEQTLPRLGGHLAYWFGWFAFFPNTVVYGN
ncbi:MAG: DUF3179 domain-containing protein [Ardenticatenaceae bacterium]|nr:DUF3179 domain-containing protein [Ardenticatenaceae bacterium]